MFKILITMSALVSSVSFAQVDASIYNEVGNYGPTKAYEVKTRPSYNMHTVHSGDTSYTTGNDSTGDTINCRTIRAGNISNTVCD